MNSKKYVVRNCTLRMVNETRCSQLTMALAGDFDVNVNRKVSLARLCWANFLARNSKYYYSFSLLLKRVSLSSDVLLRCHLPFPNYCCCSWMTMTVALQTAETAIDVVVVTCCSSLFSSFSLEHCSVISPKLSHWSPD